MSLSIAVATLSSFNSHDTRGNSHYFLIPNPSDKDVSIPMIRAGIHAGDRGHIPATEAFQFP